MSFEVSVSVATLLQGGKTWRIYDPVVITTKGHLRMSFIERVEKQSPTNSHLELCNDTFLKQQELLIFFIIHNL